MNRTRRVTEVYLTLKRMLHELSVYPSVPSLHDRLRQEARFLNELLDPENPRPVVPEYRRAVR